MNPIGEYVDAHAPMIWYMTAILMPPIRLNREMRYSRFWTRWEYLINREAGETPQYLMHRYWEIAMMEANEYDAKENKNGNE